jgi:hypothetical protein
MNSFLKLASIFVTSTLAIAASAGIAKADMVKLRDANLCLNRNGNNTLSFTTCQNGNDNQNFRRTSEDIVHSSSGLCVARDQRQRAPQNFDRAILQACNISPSIISQNGQFVLWKYQNFALDAFGNNPQNGANAQFYTKGNASQQLRFVGSVGQPLAQPRPQVQVPAAVRTDYTIKRPPNGHIACNGNNCTQASVPIITDALDWLIEKFDERFNNEYKKPVTFQTAWVIPNKASFSWDESARECDRLDLLRDGDFQLVWMNDLKTCGVFRPSYIKP